MHEIGAVMVERVDLNGKRVLVIGLARTGIATALFCASHGSKVTASDARSAAELGDSIEKLRAVGVILELGGHPESILRTQELVIPSPGVPADAPLLQNAREQSIPVWMEVATSRRTDTAQTGSLDDSCSRRPRCPVRPAGARCRRRCS